MIQKLIRNPLLYIFLCALFIRTYRLGEIPSGFHVDEVKVGWNAYSILKTGKDDWGKAWQLHYNSFGDFRPTGYFYLTIPSITIFGLNEFAVRFPSAFFGALTAVPLFYFVNLLAKNKNVSYLSSLLLAFSPWHITLSRATSEGIVSVFFVIIGIYFFFVSLTKSRKTYFISSSFFLVSSYFFHHSARLLTPLFILIIFIFNPKVSFKISSVKKWSLFLIIGLFVLTATFASNKEARGRLSQVSIFNDLGIRHLRDKLPFEEGQNKVFTARAFHNKLVLWGTRFVDEYSQYFSAKFLLSSGEAKPSRYNTVGNGVLTYAEFLFLIVGLIYIAKNKFSYLPFLLLLIAPFPAAMTTEDSPNLHRSILMIPFIATICAFGLYKVNRSLGFILLTLNFIYFSHMYLVHNRVHEPIPLSRNVGVKEAIFAIDSLRKNYDLIYVTDIPDDIYPWYAFYTKQNPQVFNEKAKERDKGEWEFENIVFGKIKCPSRDVKPEISAQKTLLIDAEGCNTDPEKTSLKKILEIKRPEGGIPYTFWSN